MDKNLQEQYALLQEEKRVNRKRTIVFCGIFCFIAILSLVIIVISAVNFR